MKKIKKLLLATLLSFGLTISLVTSAGADTLIIENDYPDLRVEHGKIISSSTSISSKKLFQAPITTVAYSPKGNAFKSKVFLKIKDLFSKKKKHGVEESTIKINKKKVLKVTYVYDIKSTPKNAEDISGVDSDDAKKDKKSKKSKKSKSKKSKGFFNKLKNKVKEKFKKKFKQKIMGDNITDVYVKILSAHVNGVELPKAEKVE